MRHFYAGFGSHPQYVSHKYLIPKFGDLLITDLTHKLLREWISNLNLTIKSARKILTPLRAVVEQAIHDELIEYNPFNTDSHELEIDIIQHILNLKNFLSKLSSPFKNREFILICKITEFHCRVYWSRLYCQKTNGRFLGNALCIVKKCFFIGHSSRDLE